MQKCQDFVNWYNLRKMHKDAKMQVCIEIVRDMEMKNHPQEIWLIWWATVIKISF